MAYDLRTTFEKIPAVKLAYNTGCLFDVASGTYLTGQYGESILIGGLTSFTGVVGIANNFKTAVMDFLMLTPMAHFPESNADTFDTETNISEARKQQVAEGIEGLSGDNNPIVTDRWQLTDNTLYFGNAWYEKKKENLKAKLAAEKQLLRVTPFLDREGKLFKAMVPTFTSIDSLTKFETEDVANMLATNELGDSGANTSYMKQGASKARFLADMPKLISVHNNPVLMTAHIGKTIAMDPRAAPVKKLQYLKNGDQMKGVTDQFLFLTTNCWQCSNAVPWINDLTKGPEYPISPLDDMKGDTDLNLVTLSLLRNKSGRSGLVMQILVSQESGVLPSLSEFHYIKTNKFGLGGNQVNYYVELVPEIKLSRTVVRGKINKEPALRRALLICSEMCQMFMLWSVEPKYVCTAKELYDDLKDLGYSWSALLATRSWWTFDNDKHPIHFLSTKDLLRMRVGEYIPYWMEEPPAQALAMYNKTHDTPWAPRTILPFVPICRRKASEPVE